MRSRLMILLLMGARCGYRYCKMFLYILLGFKKLVEELIVFENFKVCEMEDLLVLS